MKFSRLLFMTLGLGAFACSTGSQSARFFERAEEANRDSRRLMRVQKELCEKGSGVDCSAYAYGLWAEGKKEEALAAAAVACEKGLESACVRRASFQYSLGQFGEAEEALNAACEKEGNAICSYAGQIAAQKGNPARALNYFKKACQSGDLASCVLHGRGLRIQNQFGLATPSLRKACDEKLTPACTDLGMILWAEGREEKAINELESDCERRYDRACRFANILRLKRTTPDFGATKETECKKGSKDACHATALLQFLRKGGRSLGMHRWRENCKAGHALSCWDVAIENVGIRPINVAEDDARASCEAQVGHACYILAETARSSGDLKTAYALWGKACELGESHACQAAAQDSSLSDADRLRFLKLACDQGLKSACREAGTELYFAGRTEDAKAFLDVACPTRTALGCIDLASTPSDSNRFSKVAPEDLSVRCNEGEAATCTYQGHALFKAGKKAEASNFFTKGCKYRDGDACAFMGQLSLDVGQPDRARGYYRQACDLKSTAGCEGFLALFGEER